MVSYCLILVLFSFTEKLGIDNENGNSFGDFLNLPAPKTKLAKAIEELDFGSCEIDEKNFINEVIHESNSYNEKWLQE